jgi:hypothetical protein
MVGGGARKRWVNQRIALPKVVGMRGCISGTGLAD